MNDGEAKLASSSIFRKVDFSFCEAMSVLDSKITVVERAKSKRRMDLLKRSAVIVVRKIKTVLS